MKGVVKKGFPFAFDGNTITQMKAGADFPPTGFTVQDTTFQGLVDAGYVEAEAEQATPTPEEHEMNVRIIGAFDKRLSSMSDDELKAVIARRGTPFSGNMVHAVLVGEAKAQMLAEIEGVEPVLFINPDAGVTEQPLAARGAPTPPSAAAAVDQQKALEVAAAEAEVDAPDQADEGESDMQSTGENKATNQFGEPLSDMSKPDWKTEAELNTMNKADLEAYAKEKGIDLTAAKTKADYVEALKPKA